MRGVDLGERRTAQQFWRLPQEAAMLCLWQLERTGAWLTWTWGAVPAGLSGLLKIVPIHGAGRCSGFQCASIFRKPN
jgi:hypothetical protein